ncbi:hypothetical protein BC830DRAFT_1171800 [Chytriomyces sp. MP71]|nr:hypothetical protein BC830DRAFT_1171800 [Chytriomyces sp. MP71]
MAYNEIKGPKDFPGSGNLYDVFPDSLNSMRRLLSQYFPLMKLKYARTHDCRHKSRPIANSSQTKARLSGSAFMDHLLKSRPSEDKASSKPIATTLTGSLLTNSYFLPQGHQGLQQRDGRKLTDIFAVYTHTGENVLITRWMTNFTFETIGKTDFGYDFHLLDTKDAPVHAFIKVAARERGQTQPFAMQEAKTGLAVMLWRFKFTTVDPSKVSYDPKCPTTLPVNLRMKITKRKNLPTAISELPIVKPDFANGTPADGPRESCDHDWWCSGGQAAEWLEPRYIEDV